MNKLSFKTYVLKYEDKYLKFGSYGTARLVDNPTKASTYSTFELAQKRKLDRSIYITNRRTISESIKIVELELSILKETQL